jgi:hypothetical protein
MPLDATSMARDYDSMAPDYPGTIVHGGDTISGTVSPVERQGELSEDMAGVSGNDVVEFCGKITDFAAEPQSKDEVTYAGAVWLIQGGVTIDAACYTFRIVKQ